MNGTDYKRLLAGFKVNKDQQGQEWIELNKYQTINGILEHNDGTTELIKIPIKQ